MCTGFAKQKKFVKHSSSIQINQDSEPKVLKDRATAQKSQFPATKPKNQQIKKY